MVGFLFGLLEDTLTSDKVSKANREVSPSEAGALSSLAHHKRFMSINAEYHHAVSLGFGDVVQTAYGFSETGEPEWGRLCVVGGPTSSGSSRDIGLGPVGIALTRDDGSTASPGEMASIEPCLDFLGSTENPVAVRVFGTLAVDEMRVLLARGWRNVRDPSIALNIYFPKGRARDPRFYSFLADLSFTDNPNMYAPQA